MGMYWYMRTLAYGAGLLATWFYIDRDPNGVALMVLCMVNFGIRGEMWAEEHKAA